MVLHLFKAVVSHLLGGNGNAILELLLISSNTNIDIHADIHIYILICIVSVVFVSEIACFLGQRDTSHGVPFCS